MLVVQCYLILMLLICTPLTFCVEVKIISNYFKFQNIYVVTAYVCNRKDALLLFQNLSIENFRLKVHSSDWNNNLDFKARPFLQGIFIDLTCDVNKKFIINEYKPMSTGFKWFAWLGNESFNCLGGSFIGADTDMVVATEAGILYEAYRISLAHPATVNLIGNWTSSGEFTIGPRPFRDLSGATLRGAMFFYHLKVDKTNYSDLILNKMIEPDLDLFQRFHYALEEDLRFFYKYNLQPVFTNATGILLPNGKFSGEIGDIASNKSDIGLSPLRYLAMRAKYLSYLPDLQVFRIIFGFMNPKTVGTYKALLLPLSEGVWATLAGITVATILCYHFIQRYSINRQDDCDIGAGVVYAVGLVAQQVSCGAFLMVTNLISIILGIFSLFFFPTEFASLFTHIFRYLMLLKRDWNMPSSGLVGHSVTFSFRIMSVLLLLLALLVSNYYNASIMYGLLSEAPTKIKTLDQLTDSHLGLGHINLPYLTLKENMDIYFSKKIQKKIYNTKNSVLDLHPGLQRVRTSSFAFAVEDGLFRIEANNMFTNREKCDLKELELTRFPISLPLQKNSSYVELFTRGLLWIRETGISKRLTDHWYPKPAFCLATTEFVHVTLEAVSVALLIFIAGVTLSAFILLGELILIKPQQNCKVSNVE